MFSPNYITTIGVDFRVKRVFKGSEETVLQIWDTAGQERFRTITEQYYRKAHGFILVYDPTDRDTFRNLDMWMKEIQTKGPENKPTVLVANKSDETERSQVTKQQGQEFADKYGIPFYIASAKSNSNIDAIFQTLLNSLHGTIPPPDVEAANGFSIQQNTLPRQSQCC